MLRPEGDAGKPSVWFLLPRAERCPTDLAARPHDFEGFWDRFWLGTHRIDSTWSIVDDGDTVTVSPSILTSTELGEDRVRLEWHGFLERGVWREV